MIYFSTLSGWPHYKKITRCETRATIFRNIIILYDMCKSRFHFIKWITFHGKIDFLKWLHHNTNIYIIIICRMLSDNSIKLFRYKWYLYIVTSIINTWDALRDKWPTYEKVVLRKRQINVLNTYTTKYFDFKYFSKMYLYSKTLHSIIYSWI